MALSRFVIDVSPLRASRDFRLLFIARTISLLSVGVLSVAVNLQVFELTHSSFHVGLVSACLAFPMIAGLLVGGVLADSADRKKLMVWTRTAYIGVAMAFLLNAGSGHPQLWVIYATAGVAGLINGISTPPMMAAMPALVGREHLVAAGALTTTTTHLGAVIGPTLAGFISASGGYVACYAVVLVGIVLTPLLLAKLRPMPPGGPPGPRLAAIAEGFRFIRGNRLIGSLLLIDVAATVFAMPQALFPQIGSERFMGGARTIALLYSLQAAGSLAGALASGWINRFSNSGKALFVSVLAWGASMIGFGLSPHIFPALVFLAAGGFATTTSEILRRALLQIHTPDALQGRVSSVWLMQAIAGPSIGNMQAGLLAGSIGPGPAATAGGLLCIVGAVAVVFTFPLLRQGSAQPATGSVHTMR